MKLTFEKSKWFEDGDGFWLCLKVKASQAAKDFVKTMPDKLHEAELHEQKKIRSKDANAYCWVLIGKLAAALRSSPERVYREAIKEIGDNYEIIPIRKDAVDRWQTIWQSKGLGWSSETLGESALKGYVNTINYYGSSVYDTRQMSCLIDCIVSECKEQGIETLTPQEIDRLKEEWRG